MVDTGSDTVYPSHVVRFFNRVVMLRVTIEIGRQNLGCTCKELWWMFTTVRHCWFALLSKWCQVQTSIRAIPRGVVTESWAVPWALPCLAQRFCPPSRFWMSLSLLSGKTYRHMLRKRKSRISALWKRKHFLLQSVLLPELLTGLHTVRHYIRAGPAVCFQALPALVQQTTSSARDTHGK